MSKILSDLNAILKANNVRTSQLTDTTGQNNNLTFTDNENVFVKVNQEGRPFESLIRELKVASIIPGAIKPLYLEPLRISSNQIATVWEYKNLTPAEMLPETMKDFVKQIQETHDITPVPALVELKPDFMKRLASHVKARITESEKRKYSTEHLTKLKEIYNNLPAEPETLYSSKIVLCHNDLHLGNIVLNEGQIQIIDWEAAILAPKELDYARLKVEFPEHYDTEIVKVPLQEELVDLYVQLIELSKVAYLTRFPEKDEESKLGIERLHAGWDIR